MVEQEEVDVVGVDLVDDEVFVCGGGGGGGDDDDLGGGGGDDDLGGGGGDDDLGGGGLVVLLSSGQSGLLRLFRLPALLLPLLLLLLGTLRVGAPDEVRGPEAAGEDSDASGAEASTHLTLAAEPEASVYWYL